jgi:hypothetical protein
MHTLTPPEVTTSHARRLAAWIGPPLSVAAAAGGVLLFDAGGMTTARDIVYVLVALVWAPSLLVATRLWYVDRADISLHRACEIALGVALVLFLTPAFIFYAGHQVGGVTIGVSAVVWFVLAWVGIFRTGHLIHDRYGPGGWAP